MLACEPDCLEEQLVALLSSRLATAPMLVVARAGAASGACARLTGAARRAERVTGQALGWTGPGPQRTWYCRAALECERSPGISRYLDSGDPGWRTAHCGAPGWTWCHCDTGFPSQSSTRRNGAATALLRHLLIYSAAVSVAWLDFEGTLVLRMDDPGGAQNVHSRHWYYPKLGEAAWAAIGADLRRRQARLSVCYVAGWVDDGDAGRGTLEIGGGSPPAPRSRGRLSIAAGDVSRPCRPRPRHPPRLCRGIPWHSGTAQGRSG